jgi:hypothetical protein
MRKTGTGIRKKRFANAIFEYIYPFTMKKELIALKSTF